jgi:hypothetical protein
MEVMLAAARREKVEDRVAIAEAAGLTATVMDIESYAARAALDRASRRAGPDRSSPCSRSAPRPPTSRCCRTATPSTNASSRSAATS